jgi:hypothetical protein
MCKISKCKIFSIRCTRFHYLIIIKTKEKLIFIQMTYVCQIIFKKVFSNKKTRQFQPIKSSLKIQKKTLWKVSKIIHLNTYTKSWRILLMKMNLQIENKIQMKLQSNFLHLWKLKKIAQEVRLISVTKKASLAGLIRMFPTKFYLINNK